MTIVLSTPIMLHEFFDKDYEHFLADKAKLDSLRQFISEKDSLTPSYPSEIQNLFPFNPNSATSQQLQSLGFQRKSITALHHYLEKGGILKVKKDLRKIYGVDEYFFRKVEKYILLPDTLLRQVKIPSKTNRAFVHQKISPAVLLDINKADSADLEKLKGIGPVFSQRIIRYRTALGGFTNLAQLWEIYGVDSIIFAALNKNVFIARDFIPEKLYINRCTYSELYHHPYIRKNARYILRYRLQHGDFDSMESLMEVKNLPDSTLYKLSPYLDFRKTF